MASRHRQWGRWSGVAELLGWVAIVAIALRWPGLLFPSLLVLSYRAATRVARLSWRRSLATTIPLCVVAYGLSSGPAIRIACELGESESHPALVSAIFAAYRPLFRIGRAITA